MGEKRGKKKMLQAVDELDRKYNSLEMSGF